jgi:3-oxoacyl-[acyl-carrier protein] reductase
VSGPAAGRSVALVTGGATGIGSAIARRLGADGTRVVVNHLDSPEAADAVVEDILGLGGTAVAVQADVSRGEDLTRLFDAAQAAFGGVDVLVNNAAVAIIKPLVEFTDADIDLSLSVNVKGLVMACRLAMQRLRAGGCIVNISSSTTALMFPGYSVYDATKGAMEQLTRVLSREAGPRGLRVNAVAPGATETETYRDGKGADFLAGVEKLSAFGRLGRPEEIAAVVAWLAGPDAGWVTGQIIRANGGTA